MLFSSLRGQQTIPQNEAVLTPTAAALGISRAEYAPPKIPVTFWPDFPVHDLHTVRSGGETIGKLLELAFESSALISQHEYARKVRNIIDRGIQIPDTDARSRDFLPTEELFKRLLSDDLIDERAIPRHDNPADLITQTIRHVGSHLVETYSFNEAILQSGWMPFCGSASIKALRQLRLEQIRVGRPFPADILSDLWKGILCVLHDELLADVAQLSATNTPPRTIPEEGLSEFILLGELAFLRSASCFLRVEGGWICGPRNLNVTQFVVV